MAGQDFDIEQQSEQPTEQYVLHFRSYGFRLLLDSDGSWSLENTVPGVGPMTREISWGALNHLWIHLSKQKFLLTTSQ